MAGPFGGGQPTHGKGGIRQAARKTGKQWRKRPQSARGEEECLMPASNRYPPFTKDVWEGAMLKWALLENCTLSFVYDGEAHTVTAIYGNGRRYVYRYDGSYLRYHAEMFLWNNVPCTRYRLGMFTCTN